jgi:tetratricopeptide (TPR) repeat protein
MPEKKRIPAVKTEDRRMTKPDLPKTGKHSDSVRSGSTSAAAPQPWGAQQQLAAFESAMKLFHTRELQQARAFFEHAAQGPERDVAQRSKLHMAMCDRRLQQQTVTLRSAEDYYNYAVALINQRKLGEAREHLQKAVEISPGADHIHYALAAAFVAGGDLAQAHESLKRAIELDPRNRIIARQDSDFTPVAAQPPFSSLLYPEKKNW